MAKIQLKDEKITAFGGIVHINEVLEGLGLRSLFEKHLGKREAVNTKYSHYDIFKALLLTYISGGTCLEDANRRAHDFRICGSMATPNADTIGRILKDLACPNHQEHNERSGQDFAHNFHDSLHHLLLEISCVLNLFGQEEDLVMDFDHEFLSCEKWDAKYGYKNQRGYFPGIASVGNIIVGVENREANVAPQFGQAFTLRRFSEKLREYGKKFRSFRADCASYNKATLTEILQHCQLIYVRARNSPAQRKRIEAHQEWRKVEINHRTLEVATLESTFLPEQHLRLVVKRELSEDLFEEKYVYRSILTNDWDSSEEQIIELYNQRGSEELIFKEMVGDFGWGHLPFSHMEQNTVFMLFMAIVRNVYRYLAQASLRK